MFSTVARFKDAAESAKKITTKKTHIKYNTKKPFNYKPNIIARFRSLREDLITICIECNHWIDLRDEGCSLDFLKRYSDNKIVDYSNKIVDCVPYKCNKCKSITDCSIVSQQKTQVQINEYEEAITKADSEILRLSQRLHNIESNINYIEQTNRSSFHDISTPQNDFETFSVHSNSSETSEDVEAELQRRLIRRKRIVFLGVPKEIDDGEFLQELADELGLYRLDRTNVKINKVFRLNSTNVKPGTLPLNVEFNDENDKFMFLNRNTRNKLSKLSKDSKFYGVTVFQDRTFNQRKKYNELKHEMNERNERLMAQNVTTYKWTIKNMTLSKKYFFDEGEMTE